MNNIPNNKLLEILGGIRFALASVHHPPFLDVVIDFGRQCFVVSHRTQVTPTRQIKEGDVVVSFPVKISSVKSVRLVQ